jgi:RNA polymerase sigma-70 factor (ECF subfamily)
MTNEAANFGHPSSFSERFATTQWSVVSQAGCHQSPMAEAALETLCERYWHPLYAYIRRRGYRPPDAQDLTQQFFAHFLRQDAFGKAAPARGRFRCYLLKSLQNFLADEWKRMRRVKRGGGLSDLSWDDERSEICCSSLGTEPATPEQAYDEHWATTLLGHALGRLQREYADAGRSQLFDQIKDHVWGPTGATSYRQIAGQFGMTEGALRVATHRLRLRFRELLRAEIAQTVKHPADIDDELHDLIQIIGGAC